ncbi:MAG: hypothetical protein WDW38_003466 [Sanguina aurantia]
MGQEVQRLYPQLEIIGSDYPVPTYKHALVYATQAAQAAAAALLFAGPQVFQALGMAEPQWYLSVAQNKVGAGFGVWFIGNMVTNSLTASGAFEVFYDGQQVFSKIEAGRMPTMEEIVTPIQQLLSVSS